MRNRPEYDLNIIGKNLKRLRQAKGFSVEEVRKYLRLGTTQAIYKYESGNGYPQVDTMFALMELYEADLHDIVDDPMENGKSRDIFSSLYEMDYMVLNHGKRITIANIVMLENNRKNQFERIKSLSSSYKKYYKAI